MVLVTFLGSLVQSCCGEGGTLQTSITGVCGECLQCFSCTGFAPAHGICAFTVYTSQSLRYSAENSVRWAPGLHALPRSKLLMFRFLSTPQSCRLSLACILCPSQVRKAQMTRCLANAVTPRWVVHLIASPIPASQFSGCTMGTPSQACLVSLLGS